jgi:hypothetical protein
MGGAQELGADRQAVAGPDADTDARGAPRRSGLAERLSAQGGAARSPCLRSGQFFVPHQDSEKSYATVGTLSLILPGPSRGGALVIEHAGSKLTYRASDRLLTFVAFYADCRHEVQTVTSGYRVWLGEGGCPLRCR